MEESQSFIYNLALKSRVGMKPITFKTTFATYEATKILGEGGAGRVYSATDESGGDGAIKLLDPAKATKEKIKRFKNEYTFCSRNTHEIRGIMGCNRARIRVDSASDKSWPEYKG